MIQKTETLQEVDLLRYYATEWDNYTTGAKYLNRLFTFLNRYWVKRERDEGRKGVYQVYTVTVTPFEITKHPNNIAACPVTMENPFLHAPTK